MVYLPPQQLIRPGTEINVHGLICVIETPQYDLRIGKDWMHSLPAHYGYIKGYIGADGDAIDCYIGPESSSNIATVINQNKMESVSFDEHKVMLLYDSERSALRDYFDGHTFGHAVYRGHATLTIRELRRWLKHGDLTKPIERPFMADRDKYSEVGEVHTGFVKSNNLGPFKCANCVHNDNGWCFHPDMMKFSEEPRDRRGYVKIHPNDCCTFIRRPGE